MKTCKCTHANSKRKYRLAILSTFIIITLLSGLASAKPPAQNTGLSKENILWMSNPHELLDKTNVNTALQQIIDSKFTSIAVFRGSWSHDGKLLELDGIQDYYYQQFLSTVKGFNSNLKVYICNYGNTWINDDGSVAEPPDVGLEVVRKNMASAVKQELGLVSLDGNSSMDISTIQNSGLDATWIL